jgi:hypothetical protein
VPKPETTHPAWPKSNSKTEASTHRCKSCHGWDYKGKDGAHSSGKYMTGIKGTQFYNGKEKKEIISILSNRLYNFGDKMSPEDLDDLAFIVSNGQKLTLLNLLIQKLILLRQGMLNKAKSILILSVQNVMVQMKTN